MSSIASRLAELEGLDRAKILVERLAAEPVAQGVLFYGAPGSGKGALATILAQAWLCNNVEAPGCGECKNCAAHQRGVHADLLLIGPTKPGNVIKVSQIVKRFPEEDWLPLLTFARSAPLMGRHKVIVMRDADRMTEEASNALLKTLEEPPPYLKFVLTSSEIRRIRPTILSRCLSLACELPCHDVAEDSELWALAGGAPARVMSMQSQVEVYLAINRFAAQLPTRRRSEALIVADEFRSLADKLELEGGARAENSEALATLGAALGIHHPHRPDLVQAAAEAHRRIVGNGGAAYTFDVLFATILK